MNSTRNFSLIYSTKLLEQTMKSSTTSTWELAKSQKLSSVQEIGIKVLATISTRELVEFYWTNRKRFSGGYKDFPQEVS